MNMEAINEPSSIEFLTIADHADVCGGLLYLSGACWTDYRRVLPPDGHLPPTHFGIALSVYIPWNRRREAHAITIDLETEDGPHLLHGNWPALVNDESQGLAVGSDQHSILAIRADLVFPAGGGGYVLLASLNGDQSVRRWVFRVHDVQGQQLPSV